MIEKARRYTGHLLTNQNPVTLARPSASPLSSVAITRIGSLYTPLFPSVRRAWRADYADASRFPPAQLSHRRGNFVVHTMQKDVQYWSAISTDIDARSEGNDWWRVAKFGPDEKIIFGINYFGEMTVWDTNMSMLNTFQVSSWHVDHIEFIRDGTAMVLPAADGTIRLWGIPASSE